MTLFRLASMISFGGQYAKAEPGLNRSSESPLVVGPSFLSTPFPIRRLVTPPDILASAVPKTSTDESIPQADSPVGSLQVALLASGWTALLIQALWGVSIATG